MYVPVDNYRDVIQEAELTLNDIKVGGYNTVLAEYKKSEAIQVTAIVSKAFGLYPREVFSRLFKPK